MKGMLSRGRVERLVMAERHVPPRRTPSLFCSTTRELTPHAMRIDRGLIQLGSTFEQPLDEHFNSAIGQERRGGEPH